MRDAFNDPVPAWVPVMFRAKVQGLIDEGWSINESLSETLGGIALNEPNEISQGVSEVILTDDDRMTIINALRCAVEHDPFVEGRKKAKNLLTKLSPEEEG